MTASTNTGAKSAVSQGQKDLPQMAPASSWTPSKKLSHRKRRRIVRYVIAALVVAAYAAGMYYFSSHFTPGTTVDGVDASNMTVSELAEALEKRSASYTQHITNGDGFETSFTSQDVSLTCEGTASAEEALKRTTPLLWLPSLLTPQHMLIDTQMSIDEEALSSLIGDAVASYNEGAEQPTNAKAVYNKETHAFELTKEAVGTAIDASKIIKTSTVAIQGLQEELELDDSVLLQPEVTDQNEELQAAVKEANKILDAGEINVVCDDETITTIDRDTMASWISITDDNEVDIDGVGEWVLASEAINDAGNATDEEHVWALDAGATVDNIHNVLENEQGSNAELIRYAIETKPVATPGAKERGRHIDINLSTQYVRFYDENGKVIWESYCVTGGYDPEYGEMHYTPTGTFAIQSKETGRTLVGADSDGNGEPDYESFVNFWMPFLNYDYGLHDATWRYDFGGEIRSWWGSHGCVNLPYEKAAELFNLVNVGDMVYVHE